MPVLTELEPVARALQQRQPEQLASTFYAPVARVLAPGPSWTGSAALRKACGSGATS